MSELMPLPDNPALLAALRAEEMALSNTDFEITKTDEFRLAELEVAAEQLGFLGSKYFVESHRSLSMPVTAPEGQANYFDFMGLSFEGEFVTYSKVVIGRIIGARAVRALCLTFDKVTLLPYFDSIPEDHLLHVPVLAIESMHSEAA